MINHFTTDNIQDIIHYYKKILSLNIEIFCVFSGDISPKLKKLQIGRNYFFEKILSPQKNAKSGVENRKS